MVGVGPAGPPMFSELSFLEKKRLLAVLLLKPLSALGEFSAKFPNPPKADVVGVAVVAPQTEDGTVEKPAAPAVLLRARPANPVGLPEESWLSGFGFSSSWGSFSFKSVLFRLNHGASNWRPGPALIGEVRPPPEKGFVSVVSRRRAAGRGTPDGEARPCDIDCLRPLRAGPGPPSLFC